MTDKHRGYSELALSRMEKKAFDKDEKGHGSYPHGGGGEGGGGSAEHDAGKSAAATAMAKAGSWMAGKGATSHDTREKLANAVAGAHEHLTSQGLVAGKAAAVFGSPGGQKVGYYAKGQENNPYAQPKVTVETGHAGGTGQAQQHWMQIKANK